MKNQIFDWSRFLNALRKEAVENCRTLVFSLIGIYGVLAMIMTLGNLITGDDTTQPTDVLRYVMVYVVFSISGIIVASLAFRGLKTKTGRIELLTSPSSTFEKFMVNFVIYVLGFIVAFPICAQLADLTRIAILWPWSRGEGVPGPINFLSTIHAFATAQRPSGIANVWFEANLWIGVLASPCLYLLGSILWPRLSFLKTFAAIYAIEFVAVILFMIGVVTFGDMKSFGEWVIRTFAETNVMMWLCVWTSIQLVLFLAVSWWLWKRKDVISLKWWS